MAKFPGLEARRLAGKRLHQLLVKQERKRGFLIAFEGPDGSGKTTQRKLFKKWLKGEGHPVVTTRWNSSPLISPLIKSRKRARAFSPEEFCMLHAADFRQRLENVILPALWQGKMVVADRLDDSAFIHAHGNHACRNGNVASLHFYPDQSRCIRKSDSLFRYGGEEFVVLSNKICPENANALAEKIRSHIESNCFVNQDKSKNITVSIGVTLLKEGDTEHCLFERADQAMYVSKHNGRNTVTMNC